MKKKFTTYANCQSRALALTLKENEEFNSKYDLVPIRAIQTLKPQDAAETLEKVKSVDLFIHQPIAETKTRPRELSSNYLLNYVKDGAESISFPSLYFDGYFPHLKTFNGMSAKLNLVHDYFIAYLFATGRSQEEAYQIIQSENLYPKALSEGLLERSISNLEQKEKDSSIDIVTSTFIKEGYRKEKLFFQFNHPNRTILNFIAESILKKIGINDYRLENEGVQRLDGIITPIYRSTYSNLGLTFDEAYDDYKSGDERGIRQTSIIQSFYEFYSTLDKSMIIDHVEKNRPFVARLIKRM